MSVTTEKSSKTSVKESTFREKRSVQDILKEARSLKKEEQRRIWQNRELEKYKFNQFKKSIEGKEYFRIHHIDDLRLDYDICIHLSSKGAGKTTELMRMMERVIERGEKFMYGRVYKNELDREIIEFNNRDDSPVYGIEHKGTWYFFKKGDVASVIKSNEEYVDGELLPYCPTWRALDQAGCKHVGRGYTFLNANCLSGGKYENYTTIFFDEILSYSAANRVNKRTLDSWDVSVHTVQRNKESLKIYLFGNLQDVPDHPILNHYGIDISDNLRYIQRGDSDHGCNILYINSGGLYGATIGNKGGAAHHTNVERQLFLKHNKVIKSTDLVLNPTIFGNMNHEQSFAMRAHGRTPFLYVELRRQPYEEDASEETQLLSNTPWENEQEEPIYCVTCGELTPTTLLNGEIYAEDPVVYNTFLNTRRTHSIENVFNRIYRLFQQKLLYFDSLQSLENFYYIVAAGSQLIYDNQYVKMVECP